MKLLILIFSTILLSGCTGIPDKVTPIQSFELKRYLGKLYEIARLDHRFERGLEQITAEYSMMEDGGVKVINRGYSTEDLKWSEAEGKAYFVDKPTTGHLKVSFFGPFYGSYILFELDQVNYQYAFVSGPDLTYLWLLSRTPNPPQELINQFISKAKEIGFNTDELIFVNHNSNEKSK